jgi:hypothetical protein
MDDPIDYAALIAEEMAECANIQEWGMNAHEHLPEESESIMVRVTIKQLSDVTTRDGKVRLHGCEPNHIVLIGKIVLSESTDKFVRYAVDDSTGIISVTLWLDDGQAVPTIPDGLVRFVAKPTWADGMIQLVALNIRSPDRDETEYNRLSAQHSELQYRVSAGLPIC